MLKILTKRAKEKTQSYAEILKKKPKKNKLRGGQDVPMDIDKINASLEATQKTDPEPEPKKKKAKYLNILMVPVEYLTGWQEVTMNLDRIDNALEATRRPLIRHRHHVTQY